MTNVELLARRKKLLGAAYSLFYAEPVHIVRGEGVWLYDADGRKYLDMYNNVPHVGHCHPHVVKAICKQAAVLNTHTRYLHENVLDYAERLTAKFSPALDTAMFCCTGSEANELALRIARKVTGGEGLIVTDFAYHGNTRAIHEISTESCPASERPAWVVTVPTPDCYRGLYRDADAAARYAAHVQEAVDTLKERGFKPAALVMDTIISSGGVVRPPPGYLRRVADIVQAAGGLFVADEVQPGFGRTGRNFWGYEADAVEPDIVTMGKPMGNGHPIAALVTRAELTRTFSRHDHYFNTFGGNPVSCAAALAVLDVIESENLQQNALDVGEQLVAGLQSLADRHEVIGDVRGNGLFIAVEFVADRAARTPDAALAGKVVNELRLRGVLTGVIGPDNNILKLRPPMVIKSAEAELMLSTLDDVLQAVAGPVA
ncbi:MAG: aminotransferase class III-fold pyridoxal phosphate-dependent enzyme [Gammaproteobacteria bacterium]|nr:aminotransferase class III-fold pyridoxal phosphate-dependent enzyme [Gammaproteobacteria bacterium]MDH5303906.1 aminotransferase class III-fold pyridoxal phosphate-dependent enzyme [Gammaproteobacteria bacterium]MDH5321798.1 aminotransferase class III-fold pyridoxal phosphate-dependent enzyme [Gammaproteobacteria bacterium]